MSLLTIDKLKSLITQTSGFDGRRIYMQEYMIRKNYLLDVLSRLINILRLNYWPQLTECFRGLTTNSSPEVVMGRAVSRLGHDISSRMLREYILRLSAVLTCIKNIDSRVDNYIEYETLTY